LASRNDVTSILSVARLSDHVFCDNTAAATPAPVVAM
jgi:hypothetical protein